VGLAFVLLCFIAAPAILGGLFRDLETLKANDAPALRAFPPLWFVGLYETLLGTRDLFFRAGALKAGVVLGLAFLGFIAAAALSYARHVRRTLETARRPGQGPAGLRTAWRRLLAAAVLRTPEERAVHGFFTATLRSSPRHRMPLVYSAAAGSAVVLTLIAAHRQAFQTLTPTNGFLLVVPLIPTFAVLAGVRAVADRPAALEANWIFRLTESGRTRLYASGLKKAVVLRFLLPWFASVTAVHAALWDIREAGLHGAFGLVVSFLALEILFFRYRKVPFACSWAPGKLRLQFTAIPALVGLLLLMAALAEIEKGILASAGRGFLYLGLAAAVAIALRQRNRRFYRTAALLFEEEPLGAIIELPNGD
jgi:hypothetical protein